MPLLLAIFLLSAGALAYEVLLMRLFSIIDWHHFAYMIISLALLGYGASGTFLTVARCRLLPHFPFAFVTNAVLFSLFAVASFVISQELPFNPLELVWDPRQFLYLSAVYLLLSIPFFCVANCIGLTFTRFQERIGGVYRADLLGAGAGALGIIALLFAVAPSTCLKAVGSVGFLASGVACLDRNFGRRLRLGGTLVAAGLAAFFVWPEGWATPKPSPFKGLSLALRVPGVEVIEERSSPLGLLTVLRSPEIPFRHAPGLSLNCPHEPREQLGIFTDGDSLSVITRFDGDPRRLVYLDFVSSALPYHLLHHPRVLIVGAGGGSEILRALHYGAPEIDAVEFNPQMVEIVRDSRAEFAGHLYNRPEVRVHIDEARSFLAHGTDPYDLIQLSLLDSFTASSAGVHALSESSLYTVEALQFFLRRLRPEGLLAITRWLKLPPRDSLKLFATAVAALEAEGSSDPGRSVALIRSWKTVTLLVKSGAFTAEEIAALREFCDQRWFDVAYLPGITAVEANRYNLLEEPYLYEGTVALLGQDRAEFSRRYKFYIEPATDDRPYFFHFFKWRSLAELLAMRDRGGTALLEWGYLILMATLAQAAAAGLVFILLPLWFLRRRSAGLHGSARVVLYFFALGLAFLFIEIAFIQRFTLFLGHPLYAVAVVLASFLVFAGLGSGYSQSLQDRPPLRPVDLPVGGIALLSLVYLVALPPLFRELAWLAAPVKAILCLVLIAPLAFCMGMPFPLGLQTVGRRSPDWIPWAWGINGCASVLSAVLATLLAIHLGFSVVITAAVVLYLLAAAALRGV